MHRNLREAITDRIQQNYRMMQESCEGFADNHDAVHAELERQLSRRQLSSRNPRLAAVREQTPLNNHAGGLEHYRQSQDASQGSELSFDYNQVSFAQVLQMLDSDPVSLVNSQELTLGLAQEGPATPGFASRLWLSRTTRRKVTQAWERMVFCRLGDV